MTSPQDRLWLSGKQANFKPLDSERIQRKGAAKRGGEGGIHRGGRDCCGVWPAYGKRRRKLQIFMGLLMASLRVSRRFVFSAPFLAAVGAGLRQAEAGEGDFHA